MATLNAALDACYRHWPAALHLLQEMELKGPAPNAVSYKVRRYRASTEAWSLAGRIDVKNAKPTGVSVFETLFETPKPNVSAF